MEKRKLLWHSNAPTTGTGYGTQTALFGRKLAEHYDLSFSAFYGVEGAVIPWNGIPILPAGLPDRYGNDTIREHLNAVGDEDTMVVTLMDVWVLDTNVWAGLNVASWVPVDHEPAPRPVVDFFKQTGSAPIAMSRFGERMLRDQDLDPLYVPHGIETGKYRHDRAKSREALGVPESAFIVGMVAANKGNPSRKCFAEALSAFKAFRDSHPEALMLMATEATGRFGGVNLPELVRNLRLDPESVIFTDQYRAVHFPQTTEKMGEIFSAFDVLLSPSAGEGFGISVIEAQAAGVPVIVSDFSAQPELVGAGWTVEGVDQYTAIGSWQFKPLVQDILDALKKCYRRSGREVADMSRTAVEFAKGYDADRVFAEHMLPALAECEKRFEARKPATLKAAA